MRGKKLLSAEGATLLECKSTSIAPGVGSAFRTGNITLIAIIDVDMADDVDAAQAYVDLYNLADTVTTDITKQLIKHLRKITQED